MLNDATSSTCCNSVSFAYHTDVWMYVHTHVGTHAGIYVQRFIITG